MRPASPEGPPVPVLREDSHLLAVFKPPGWIVQGATPGQPSLLEALREWVRVRDGKPGQAFLAVVHRIDRPVSGVVVLAKRTKAAQRLSAEIREGRFEKVYRAVVEGVPEPGAGHLVDHLRWDDASRCARITSETTGSSRGELDYRVLTSRGGRSLLEVLPRTGRKHQIRAQLAHLGFPIAGDTRYGAPGRPGREIALLAWRASFRHPVRSEETVAIEVPEDLDPTPRWLAGSR